MAEVQVSNMEVDLSGVTLVDEIPANDTTVEETTPTAAQVATAEPETVAEATPEVTASEETATGDDISNESTFELGGEFKPLVTGNDQPAQPEQKTLADWKETIKSIDKKEIAKEIGLDDFVLELNEHIKNGGNAYDYIFAKTFDWNKVPDEMLIKNEMAKDNPNLSQEQIDKLFSKKYSQNDFADDEEKELGKIMMQSEAYKLRQAKIDEQKKFQLPDPKQAPLPDDVKQVLSEVQAVKQKNEQLKSYVLNDNITKQLFDSKRVAVQLADNQKFNFNIDNPNVLLDVLVGEGNDKYGLNDKGEPDMQLAYELALYKINPAKFKQDIFNYGRSVERKAAVESGQNAKKPERKIPMPKSDKVVVVGETTIQL